jgi:hypothetical protein
MKNIVSKEFDTHFSSLDDMPINANCQHCIYDSMDPFWTQELVEGFDQETAAVVLARYISLKMEMEVNLCHHDSSYNCSCHLGWLYWLQSLWWHWFSICPEHIMLLKNINAIFFFFCYLIIVLTSCIPPLPPIFLILFKYMWMCSYEFEISAVYEQLNIGCIVGKSFLQRINTSHFSRIFVACRHWRTTTPLLFTPIPILFLLCSAYRICYAIIYVNLYLNWNTLRETLF